ncbi:hypothetical protein D3C81_900870 [compost metagenome]
MGKVKITIQHEDGRIEEHTVEGYQYIILLSKDDDMPSSPDHFEALCSPLFVNRAITKLKEEEAKL